MEFINQVLTEKGIVKIVENIDAYNIILNGKPMPEAVINSFGLEYDTLSALGITEEQINTDFKALINMISKGAVKVINAAKKEKMPRELSLPQRKKSSRRSAAKHRLFKQYRTLKLTMRFLMRYPKVLTQQVSPMVLA